MEGTMESREQLEGKIKELIIESLMLEDMSPDDIGSDEPLFGDGLGLDSIDALEIAMALEQTFGVVTDADDERNPEHFACVRNLAAYVMESSSGQGRG
jgi:acyl carrier protein